MDEEIESPDQKTRCSWCQNGDTLITYHDCEWGVPVGEDYRLFESLCLESFQSGLSWRIILAKRQNFRKAFMNFNFDKISVFSEKDVVRLLNDSGIVRHKRKILSVINNAKVAQNLVSEFGSFAHFIWSYEPQSSDLTPESSLAIAKRFAKDIKKRSWILIGPKTAHSFFKAIGLINAHSIKCFRREEIHLEQKSFLRPTNVTSGRPD